MSLSPVCVSRACKEVTAADDLIIFFSLSCTCLYTSLTMFVKLQLYNDEISVIDAQYKERIPLKVRAYFPHFFTTCTCSVSHYEQFTSVSHVGKFYHNSSLSLPRVTLKKFSFH